VAIIPPPLKPGARLAAVSPSGPINTEEVENGRKSLESEGFEIAFMPGMSDRKKYLAGDDNSRARDVMDAFLDPSIDGIICTRGGYGSMRIIDILDFDLIASHPKPFIGFSDLTALQLALWQRKKYLTFSGPQLAKGWGEDLSEFSKSSWLDMLAGRLWNRPLPFPNDIKKLSTLVEGKAEGRLIGGNLAMLAAMCGTADSPVFEDSILILEEIDEPLYRIDRMLTQLRLSGCFNGIKGIILGRFVQHEKEVLINQENDVAELIFDTLPSVPVAGNAPYGHVGDCWTLPLGAWAELDTVKGSLHLSSKM